MPYEHIIRIAPTEFTIPEVLILSPYIKASCWSLIVIMKLEPAGNIPWWLDNSARLSLHALYPSLLEI
jgi:hypothetical protein